ncbi:hypothetical protein DLAC_08908 [Tieghemostelium lacteum]|uniref:F-box domain-containing protein n=1 Tax=Tieghemostelium lacteum TaxID=361077 RepID=A0A151Z8N4_TIELA|nr:hypothetical protein DLAC_08908 [Tieghemostelium lacteum]|eukprot:KYQ90306.1 hypothetical protein DLAC_08908 [Tieghemostelium lacteum]
MQLIPRYLVIKILSYYINHTYPYSELLIFALLKISLVCREWRDQVLIRLPISLNVYFFKNNIYNVFRNYLEKGITMNINIELNHFNNETLGKYSNQFREIFIYDLNSIPMDLIQVKQIRIFVDLNKDTRDRLTKFKDQISTLILGNINHLPINDPAHVFPSLEKLYVYNTNSIQTLSGLSLYKSLKNLMLSFPNTPHQRDIVSLIESLPNLVYLKLETCPTHQEYEGSMILGTLSKNTNLRNVHFLFTIYVVTQGDLIHCLNSNKTMKKFSYSFKIVSNHPGIAGGVTGLSNDAISNSSLKEIGVGNMVKNQLFYQWKVTSQLKSLNWYYTDSTQEDALKSIDLYHRKLKNVKIHFNHQTTMAMYESNMQSLLKLNLSNLTVLEVVLKDTGSTIAHSSSHFLLTGISSMKQLKKLKCTVKFQELLEFLGSSNPSTNLQELSIVKLFDEFSIETLCQYLSTNRVLKSFSLNISSNLPRESLSEYFHHLCTVFCKNHILHSLTIEKPKGSILREDLLDHNNLIEIDKALEANQSSLFNFFYISKNRQLKNLFNKYSIKTASK